MVVIDIFLRILELLGAARGKSKRQIDREIDEALERRRKKG